MKKKVNNFFNRFDSKLFDNETQMDLQNRSFAFADNEGRNGVW